MEKNRYEILETPVDVVDMQTALAWIADAVKQRTTPGFVLAVNPEKVFALRRDSALKRFFEQAYLLIPDGIGIVKALHILYGIKVSRIPGADLMQQICADAPRSGYRIFIYGANEHVSGKVCEILKQRYPGIQIIGRSNGFVKTENMPELIDRINMSCADILFIAMGSPKQEQWMEEYAGRLTTVRICQGIGGTLDTIVGTVKRAPLFWQKLELEWFYRLLCQPRRFKRQLRCFKFAFEVYLQKFFKK